MKTKFSKEKIMYIAVMCLYGTTGIFKRFVPMSSAFVAMFRAVIGTAFLFAFIKLSNRRIDTNAIKKNLKWLLLVGVLLGFNWILYFEACTYTTVAKASLCYYMSPVIVLLTSPIFFNEKLTAKKIICIIIAVLGMVLVSGLLSDDGVGSVKGIFLGLSAAVFYAAIVISSRQVKDISPYDKTLVQLGVAAAIMIPYYLISEGLHPIESSWTGWLFALLLGVLNTGIAYVIYFGSVTKLDAQTVAIYAYADPIVSVLLSAVVLSEPLGVSGAIGAAMVIGSMIISET